MASVHSSKTLIGTAVIIEVGLQMWAGGTFKHSYCGLLLPVHTHLSVSVTLSFPDSLPTTINSPGSVQFPFGESRYYVCLPHGSPFSKASVSSAVFSSVSKYCPFTPILWLHCCFTVQSYHCLRAEGKSCQSTGCCALRKYWQTACCTWEILKSPGNRLLKTRSLSHPSPYHRPSGESLQVSCVTERMKRKCHPSKQGAEQNKTKQTENKHTVRRSNLVWKFFFKSYLRWKFLARI